MVYRMRTYQGIAERLEDFHTLFNTHLKSILERHGARTVGRWQTLEGRQIVAIFEYDSLEHYRLADAAARSDPQYLAVMKQALEVGALYESFEDLLMRSTDR